MSGLLRILKNLIRPYFEVAQVKVGKRKPKAALPNWESIIGSDSELWNASLQSSADGKRVLMASAIGGHPQFTVLESSLNAALVLRGANVDVMLCDAAMPACQRAKVASIKPSDMIDGKLKDVFCSGCVATGNAVFSAPGIPRIKMSDWISDAEREEAKTLCSNIDVADIPGYVHDGLPIGEHALAGALRYYGVGDLSEEPEGEEVLRLYLEASLLTAFCTKSLIKAKNYDVVVNNHGIYVPHGIVSAVCRKENVRTASWNLAYRKQCAIFSHNDTYHHTLMDEPTTDWENMNWSEKQDREISEYLESRRKGSRDWIWFNRDADNDIDGFASRVGLDWSRPVIGMLTNVVWDAQLHYPANAFPGMVDWVLRTVEYFKERSDLQLLIRVHPGELAPPGGSTVSRQPIAEEIRSVFGNLPENVFIIGPESSVSTYAAMDRCDSVLIYGTKTGVELTSVGIPVVVGGEAWIRNKGLTMDATSAENYFSHLDKLPLRKRMEEKDIVRAKKYAYHFFFRRMIPLPFLKPTPQAWPPFELSLGDISELKEQKHKGLDVICDGILYGSPFIYQAEHLGLHDE
ncbi:capsule biosynthesis protein [Thalassospira sp. ER-Se-21-Dark]|uniref:capsule biosynthesis protein n=1 Tax=Thalassospira sp. ER-Se-21-Dark TaxID=2585190 RepID=UPI001B313F46|nr:capsule biosynthesis protein [Thalassospira sp. ER-Se-21-Dark]MBP3128262.1 capsular biosynthesis protein [Thalassospira sp. ER-Se-21-Dark]